MRPWSPVDDLDKSPCMNGELALGIAVFLASAVSVILLGNQLAKFGDVLASLTGWGRLFVGSILVALATSLPELSTNISAVRLDPPNPELAVGNVLGANMVNMFTMSVVALIFGGKSFLQRVSPKQGYLIVLAAILTGSALLFGVFRPEISFWNIGAAAVIVLIIYVVGMWVVYTTRPQDADDGNEEDPGITLTRAWVMFGLVSLGVVVAGFFLAWSTDLIAEVTGVASSTLGILAVSVVTTMPEAAATVAAVRMGAPDLGVSGLFGSCVFNVTILSYADPFYREGILFNQTEPAHFVAGGVATVLILVGLVLILARDRLPRAVTTCGLGLMASAYVLGAIAVVRLGAS